MDKIKEYYKLEYVYCYKDNKAINTWNCVGGFNNYELADMSYKKNINTNTESTLLAVPQIFPNNIKEKYLEERLKPAVVYKKQ